MTRRHPLPWSMRGGWIHLGSHQRYVNKPDERPYLLVLGRDGGVMTALNAAEVRQLRNRLDATLTAPCRILLLQTDLNETALGEVARYVQRMADAHRLGWQSSDPTPPVEIAAPVGHPTAATIAGDLGVDLLTYPTVEAMLADGGNVAVAVVGPDCGDLAGLAHQADIAIGLIRIDQETS